MTNDERNAWRQYACAALTAILANPNEWKCRKDEKQPETLGDYMDICAIVADAMMQREPAKEE